MKYKSTEIALTLSLLFHLQWFFGNLYEEILTPNSIVASIETINAYNSYFAITEPYYYGSSGFVTETVYQDTKYICLEG